MKNSLRSAVTVLFAVLVFGISGPVATAAVTILSVQYQQDKMHPEFDCIWNSTGYPGNCASNFPGANVHVFLRNDGASNVNVTNVTLAGYKLQTIIKQRIQGGNDPYSIYYYWDDPPQAIFDAGEPVWYRHDPTNIPPGAVFQVIVRLRLVPVTQPVSVGVMTDAGTVTTNITVDANAPHIASVGFSPDLKKIYLHWRRSDGAAPTSVWMNGSDVTSSTVTVCDTNFTFGVSVITRTNPLGYMGYNIFQGVYADGKKATVGLRAWLNKFNIGTYGAYPTTTENDARALIDDYVARGLNLLIWNNGSDGLVAFLNKPDGQAYCADRDYDFLVDYPSKWNSTDPMGWYLRDEPDAHDNHIPREDNDTPPNLYLPENDDHSVGVLAMHEIFVGDELHYKQGEITPTVVNVDATYMPYNYYTYGQMADIGMSDPYYNSRQASAYWNNTNSIPLYVKPYPYIYAVSQAISEGSEPNPSLIAMMCTGDLVETNGWWPFQTAECIRMQNYYAVAGGAKSLGYWWMLSGFGDGIVTNAPACVNLWKGIGLCGNEFKTLQPLLVISHPAALTVTASTNIWVRPLLAGMDAIILVVANDYYTNDIDGFHYSPVSNATVTVTLPSWFNGSATSFEVAEQAEGVKDVSTSLNGDQLQFNLGTVNLTRLLVVTTNAQLRATIQQRYLEKSYQGVCAFAPEHCGSQTACILNAGAEDGFRVIGGGNIANNWYEFEGTYGTNVTGYDETTIKHSGSHSQRIKFQQPGGGSGGLYHRFPAVPGSNYTVSAWVYAGDTSSSCYIGVDRSGGVNLASTNVTWSSVHNSVSWAQKSVNVTATTNFMTLFYKVTSVTGIRNGYFDDATPSCLSPFIIQNPASSTNCPGSTFYFSVVASGSGTFSYQWQRNGVNLTDSGHYSGVTTANLTVTGADSNDTGSYRCVVTTSYGTVTSSAGDLVLRPGTVFTLHPVSHDLCAGGNTTFTVAATGEGTVTYQWQKNLTNINNGGHYSGCATATLTITGADSSDVANYRCVATAGCGSSTSFQGALALATASPIITGQPSAQNVASGETAVFNVGATGEGFLGYQWQKNSVNLTNGGHYSGCLTATLTVSSSDTNDAANYRCVVSNSCGSVNSSAAALTIASPCTPGSQLLNGYFDASTGAWTVATNWTSYSSGSAVFSKNTTIFKSSPNAQRIQPPTSGAGAYGGVRQNVPAGLGDAVTFRAWAYNESPSGFITTCLGAQWDGSTTRPSTFPTTNSANATWTQLTVAGQASNATNGVTLFLEARRGSSGTYFANFDSVDQYRAYVPPAPALGVAGTSAISVNVAAGCNATNSAAEYAITIGGGAYTLGTHWVQANGTVSTTVIWQSDSAWGSKTVTGLAEGTSYTLKVQARYSSALTQATSQGSGAAITTWSLPPSITAQPSAQNVCAGTTTGFSVTATGSGTLTYQWQTNGVNINNNSHYAGCTSAILWVTNAQSADQVNYRCVVSNSGGSTYSSTAALTLKAATQITGQPSAQNVCPGATATFNVAATGDGTVTYQWQTNGVNISNNSHYAGCTSATLWLTNSQSADQVNYRCVVTAGCGSVNSSTAALTLQAATQITGQPSMQNVCPGANANFSVTATGEGTVTYQWQTNGVNISDSAHYAGCTTASLTVNSATSSDAVNYRCVVTAGCGSVNSSTAPLTLKAVTTITGQPSAQNVCPGANATFSATATGEGTVTYQWQTNGVNISDSAHYAGCTTATLWVTNAQSADAVNYRCVVTAGCGSVNSSAAALTLNAATSITGQPSAQNVCPWADANFSVTATGEGTLTYQWQTNGVNISDGSHYSGCTTTTLTVNGALAGDAVNYRCVVTGGCGSANSSDAALTLKAITSITGQPASALVASGGTTNFSVTATGDGTLTYQWKKNGTNINDGGHYSGCTTATLTVSAADASDVAYYRCLVTGDCGSANSSRAAFTVSGLCDPGLILWHGDMEDVTSYSVCPDWNSYSAGPGTAVWTKEATILHGGAAAQKCRNTAGANGSLLGIYQNMTANVGDAFTFSGWVYPVSSPSAGQQVAMAVMWNGSTANPATNNGTWNISAGLKNEWTQLQNLSGNATSNSVTLFLDSRRVSSSQDLTAYWDDVVCYRAHVPPAPTVSSAATNTLNVDVQTGCNSANGSAEYAISISGGAYTLGTHWVQANGTVSTSPVWQTDATWGNKTVTGLSAGTTYTLAVQARYSSTVTQATSLGAGGVTTTFTLPTITQQPAAQNVCPGANANFSVTASGPGTLTYQWQTNGVNISNGAHYAGCTTTTLWVTNVTSTDAANYRCVVSNEGGSTPSSTAALTLKAATVVTGHPTNRLVSAGATTNFSVSATGEGTVTYQWQTNGVNISNNGHYAGCTSATLWLTNVQSADAVNYRCAVTAGCGNENSLEAQLIVNTCTATASLLNGYFDASTGSWTVATNWTSYSSGSSAFSKNTTIYQSSPNAQRIRPPTTGTGAYGGVYQKVRAGPGEAVTFKAYAYNESPSSYITTHLGVQWDGSTTHPSTFPATNSANASWTQLTVAGQATTTNGVTVFLEVKRGTTGTYYANFDTVDQYRCYVPLTPLVTGASSTSLNVDVTPGCNSTNSVAEYAISIGGGAYTLGTHFVQANGTVSTTAVWQTDATWGTKTVTGLSTGTQYTFQVKARYSSSITQQTSLGASGTGMP